MKILNILSVLLLMSVASVLGQPRYTGTSGEFVLNSSQPCAIIAAGIPITVTYAHILGDNASLGIYNGSEEQLVSLFENIDIATMTEYSGTLIFSLGLPNGDVNSKVTVKYVARGESTTVNTIDTKKPVVLAFSSQSPILTVDDWSSKTQNANSITTDFTQSSMVVQDPLGNKLGLNTNKIGANSPLGISSTSNIYYNAYSHIFATPLSAGTLTYTNTGNVLLKGSGNDAGDIVFQKSTATQLGRIWTNTDGTVGLNFASGDYTPDIAINATGKVGIGKVPATEQLEVAGNYLSTGDIILKGAANDAGDFIFRKSTGAQLGRMYTRNDGTAGLYLSSVDDIADIAIDAAGNVGIGNITPGYKLDVSGEAHAFNMSVGSSSIPDSYYKIVTPTRNWWVGSGIASNDGKFVIYDQSSNRHRFTIDGNGNVGVGATSPQAKLDIADLGFDPGIKFLTVGDDAYLTDIDQANTLGVFGNQDSKAGNIRLGWEGPTLSGANGNLSVFGSFKSEFPNVSSDWNNEYQCGFFDGDNAANSPEGGQWFWGINMGHRSNNANYRFGGQVLIRNTPGSPVLYFRSRDDKGMGTWAKVLNSVGDQSVNGNVGIGTASPSSYEHGGTNRYLEISNPETTLNSQSHIVLSSGVSTIAESSIGSISWMQPNVSTVGKGIGLVAMLADSNNPSTPAGKMVFYTRSATDSYWQERMRIASNGNVAIGRPTAEYKLDVNGTIRATEIKVEEVATTALNVNGDINAASIKVSANGQTADFVFDENYDLKNLDDVEAYIKEHKHLPEIPSAAEMEEKGVDLAEMNKLLLQKVEELTLYTIEQENKLKEREGELTTLKTDVQALKESVGALVQLLQKQ